MSSERRTASGLLDLPYVLLVLTTLFWGGNAVAGKFAVGQIDPLLLTVFRWFFGALCFAFLARAHIVRDWPVLRQHLWVLLALGMVGFSLFNVLLYSSLQYTSAINATIEQAATPFFILVLNRCFFAQRVFPAQWVALLLATAGVVLTVSRGDPRSVLLGELNRGDARMLLACLCYAL